MIKLRKFSERENAEADRLIASGALDDLFDECLRELRENWKDDDRKKGSADAAPDAEAAHR